MEYAKQGVTVRRFAEEISKWGRLQSIRPDVVDLTYYRHYRSQVAVQVLQTVWPKISYDTRVMLTDRNYFVTLEGPTLDTMQPREVYLKSYALLDFRMMLGYNARADVLVLLPSPAMSEIIKALWSENT